MSTTPAHPAATEALKRIPPLWPLGNFVAVNPFLGLLDRPYEDACALLSRVTGNFPLQAPADYLAAWRDGTITAADIAETGGDEATLLDALSQPSTEKSDIIPTVANFLDRKLPHAHWATFITDQISRWCGVNLDDNQTTWRSPWHGGGLYAGWKSAAAHDRNPEAFGLRGFRQAVAALPDDPQACIAKCLEILCPAAVEPADFLHRQLATISGWAGHIQYRVREDSLRGKPNDSLADLLAIRLAYDVALHTAFLAGKPQGAAWAAQAAATADSGRIAILTRWQHAYEAGYRRELAANLTLSHKPAVTKRPSFQAVFCIDVRSEVMRRHLEAAAPDARTVGFAGFFGFAVAHQSSSCEPSGSRCPVLLVPGIASTEPSLTGNRANKGSWKAFQNSAASCFTFVESAGLLFGATLAKRINGGKPQVPPAPVFANASAEEKQRLVATAEGALRNMGLTRDFARLVLICGHGSRSANNPHASSLDCGACGGHAGDVNARLAAATFNDPFIRASLADLGIHIPADTVFLAGLHLTTTDEVTVFDTHAVPSSHAADLAALQQAFLTAGDAVRAERAGSLGLSKTYPLLKTLRDRSADISQVRPEWGLANNAAFVAAPRWRTSALDLKGRVFLQDYDAANDPGDSILTLILCAPVVVASWINLQYHASRLDPAHLGAGNKSIHHVAGGIGVMEGNGGDLKTGLPLQSIHDGTRFVHEPRRLSVFIEAPMERIAAVLDANPGVRQLFDHHWIHLCAIAGETCHIYQEGDWKHLTGTQVMETALV
jgi:uncharacterized protein YbcC (UPF0753/DUF2309 family)